MTQEIRKQMITVCCECHHLVNEDNSRGRHLNDEEYALFGQNPNESHGYCKSDYEKQRAMLAEYAARR